MKFVQTFEVIGNGRFPFDMLRYDHCYPATEQDSPFLGWDYREDRRSLTLQRIVFSKSDMPTIGRWQSFTWEVIQSTIQTRKI